LGSHGDLGTWFEGKPGDVHVDRSLRHGADDAADEQGREANPFLGGRCRCHTLTGRLRGNTVRTASGKYDRSTADNEPTHSRTSRVMPTELINEGIV
jgi:hypothetical protein